MSPHYYDMAFVWVEDGGDGLQIWGQLQIYWISSCRELTRCGTPAWGVGLGLKKPSV